LHGQSFVPEDRVTELGYLAKYRHMGSSFCKLSK
jgi:hypothetical protein